MGVCVVAGERDCGALVVIDEEPPPDVSTFDLRVSFTSRPLPPVVVGVTGSFFCRPVGVVLVFVVSLAVVFFPATSPVPVAATEGGDITS